MPNGASFQEKTPMAKKAESSQVHAMRLRALDTERGGRRICTAHVRTGRNGKQQARMTV